MRGDRDQLGRDAARRLSDSPGGDRGAEAPLPPRIAAGELLAAYSLSEPDAGSDAAVPPDHGRPARATGTFSTAPSSGARTARTRASSRCSPRSIPARGPERHHGIPRRAGISRVRGGEAGAQDGDPRVADGRAPSPGLRGPRGEPPRRRGRGLPDRDADPRLHAADDRRHRGRGRPGRARRRHGLREGAPPVRPADRGVPGDPVHARRHGDAGPRRAAHGSPCGEPGGPGRRRHRAGGLDGEVLRRATPR